MDVYLFFLTVCILIQASLFEGKKRMKNKRYGIGPRGVVNGPSCCSRLVRLS